MQIHTENCLQPTNTIFNKAAPKSPQVSELTSKVMISIAFATKITSHACMRLHGKQDRKSIQKKTSKFSFQEMYCIFSPRKNFLKDFLHLLVFQIHRKRFARAQHVNAKMQCSCSLCVCVEKKNNRPGQEAAELSKLRCSISFIVKNLDEKTLS